MGNITLNKPSGGQLTIAPEDGTSNETVTIPSVGVGKVLQVVQTLKKDTSIQSSQTAWADIAGLSVSITPTSASSKIIVSYEVQYGGTNSYGSVRFVRDGNAVIDSLADSASARFRGQALLGSDSLTKFYSSSFTYVDSPSTTSAVTYKLQAIGTSSSYPLYINRSQEDADGTTGSRGVSVITVWEVAA